MYTLMRQVRLKTPFEHIRYLFLMAVLLLVVTGCDSIQHSPEDRANQVIQTLEGVSGEKERAVISALAFNTMCSISRMAAGNADGRVENAVSVLFANQSDGIKNRLIAYRDTLEQIPSNVRLGLLGNLSSFDPGQCDASPDWDRLRDGIIFSHQLVPRLRANYCSNNFTYADGTLAEREITVGSVIHAIQTEVDSGDEFRLLRSLATPALLGVERSDFVTARHPALKATADDGEGISPYGLQTDIPCSNSNNSCDASLGMICSTVFSGISGRCLAYPVVQKDQTMVLRGYNFWDVTEARLMFEPLVPGQGTESTTVISTLDPNEPTDADAACALPSLNNATHNRAHFRVTANEGHFYRIRMFNHNGQFLTQQDGIDHAGSRVIHTCYPPPGPQQDDIPNGTVRDCSFPQETCQLDGAICSGTWNTPPRQLSQCTHLPGQPPACGETPEWYEAQRLSPRGDGIGITEQAIVFVEAEAPTFVLTSTLHAMEAREETGIDFLGSDEVMLAVVGATFDGTQEISDLDNLVRLYERSYDEGDRRIEDFELTNVDLSADGEAVFLAVMMEDDGFAGAFAAGLLGIAAASAIIIATGGLSLVAAAGGAAGVSILWGLIVTEFHQPDDLLGKESISATAIEVRERIGATHASDFLTIGANGLTLFGALPPVLDSDGNAIVQEGVVRSQIIHPFKEFSVDDERLLPECTGSCSVGEVCQVNICVPANFVDPLIGVGFRERREYAKSGGRYVIDLEWEIREK